MTNILSAFNYLINNPYIDLERFYYPINRINGEGMALEFFVKDIFCESKNISDYDKKLSAYQREFSYLGSQNNPPDFIIRGGDAFEVKKIENYSGQIALNSSYPKSKLHSDSRFITQSCRDCEDWKVKDHYYVIGIVRDKRIKLIWFINGDCYAAEREIYERLYESVSFGLNQIDHIQFAKTREIARVNGVDPLGITYLRVRGMWGIENPLTVFNYALDVDTNVFNAISIMKTDKYKCYPEQDRINLEKKINTNFTISDSQIRNPNNAADMLDVKILKFLK